MQPAVSIWNSWIKRVNTGVLASRASLSCFLMASARVCTAAGLRGVQGRTMSPTHGLMAIRSWRSRSLLCRACPRQRCRFLIVLCHSCRTRGPATPLSLGLAPRDEPSRHGCLSFSFSIWRRRAVLVLSTCSTVSSGTFSRRLPLLSAGSSELERRVSAESGCPTPLALVLWILEEVSAWPTSSVGAEAVG